PLGADLSVAVYHVLDRGELAQAHRTAGVQLLRTDPDLGAEAELLAVGEPRRGVHRHHGRVDLTAEAPRRVQVTRADRLGVARAVAVDVVDGRVERGHHRHRHLQVEELTPEVVIGRGTGGRDDLAGALVAHQLHALEGARRRGQEPLGYRLVHPQ